MGKKQYHKEYQKWQEQAQFGAFWFEILWPLDKIETVKL